MKKILSILVIALFVIPAICYGWGTPAKVQKASYPFLVDKFDDGNFNKDPEWFVFDNVILNVVSNANLKQNSVSVAEKSLSFKGKAFDWYVGGMGTTLGIDGTKYDSLELNVYGNGDASGLIKVELYDDDNGNADIEVDKSWKPTSDDLWSAELPVNWTGWKHISIPFSILKKSGGGNGKFDPDLSNGSSGLNKIQIIAVASSQTGAINFNIDSLELGLIKE